MNGAVKGNKGRLSYVDRPASWEDTIASNSIGNDQSFQILVITAPPGAYEQKFDSAQILVRDEGGLFRTKEFFELAKGAKEVLSAMNPARARIRVMCSSDLSRA